MKSIVDDLKESGFDADFPYVYTYRGGAYLQIGNDDKALDDFYKAILLQPDFALAYNFRGVGYFSQLELDKAIADFQSFGIKQRSSTAVKSPGSVD